MVYPYYTHGYLTILRAFPKDTASLCSYKCAREWVWEDLLEEYSIRDKKKRYKNKRFRMNKLGEVLSCTLCECQFSGRRFDDFIHHLKTDEEHKQKHLDSVFIDANGRPFLFCEFCKYPGYDDHNMAIHLKSSEHKDLLYKTVDLCEFCNYTGDDMAFNYYSEKHTQEEIDFVLADASCRKREAMREEGDEEKEEKEEDDFYSPFEL